MDSRKYQEKYLSLAPALYRIAFSVLGNAEDAEDAVQDTFLRLCEETDRLAGMERPEAYFAVTVRNISINLLRQRHEVTEAVETMEVSAERGAADRLEARDELHDILGRLSDNERRVLLLRHAAECSFADIASLTGQTESGVRMLLSRARQRLRHLCGARTAAAVITQPTNSNKKTS